MYANKCESITGNIVLVMIPRKEKTNIDWSFSHQMRGVEISKFFYTKYMLLKKKEQSSP